MEDRTTTGPDVGSPLFETVLRTVADGITVLHPSGRLVYANEAAARMVGFDTAEELLATPVAEVMGRFEVYDEEGRPFPVENLPGRLALQGLEPRPVVLRFRTAGNSAERWSVVNATPVLDKEGKVVAATYAFHDITAAKLAEERQRFLSDVTQILNSSLNSTETFASLAELAVPRFADRCVVHVLREDGELEVVALAHADPATFRVQVQRRGEAAALAGETEAAAAVVQTGQAELGGDSRKLVVPLVTRGRIVGALAFESSEGSRPYDERDLELARILGARTGNAAENARLFQAVEERANAALVLAHIADGVLLLDEDGIVRLWNEAAETITGLAASEIVGRPAGEAIPGWEGLQSLVPTGEAHGPGAPHAVPLELGGRERWLSIAGVAFDEGTVYAFRDLTEERRVDELKTDFLATASHELRTPLAAVYGAAMTLRRRDLEVAEDAREGLLEIVAAEADRLSRIVDGILWASRVDSGRLAVAIERCDAAALARSVVSAATAHVPEGITVELQAPDGLPPIAADGDKLRQVLANLVDNAVKYSPDGGRVDVRLEAHEGRLLFAVEDEGLGIPAAEQPRIWEKFYRLDPQLTRGVGGTGLGLYICRELIKQMDGRIWVASTESAGSTFYFELPFAE